MAAKPNEPAKEAAHPPAAAAPAAGEKAAPETVAKSGGIGAFIPLIAAVVLAPVLSVVAVIFLGIPKLKKELAVPVDPHAVAAASAAEPAAEAAAEEGHGKEGKEGKEGKGKEGKGASGGTYEFENVVVNLAGTMGTRYLKVAFQVIGTDKTLRAVFESKKPQLVDVTLNVLSSLSLTDLEEAGHKNLIREKLIAAYNQAIGKRLVEQIYFSDFVVQ
ncbi:MAG: flagellar basal body-associated FliL family protein [Nibricoccus sp.]